MLASVPQRAPIGFALVDDDLRYEVVNDVLADINGVAIAEHAGRTIGEILPDVAEVVTPLLQGVIDTGEPVIGVEVNGTTPPQPGVERTWSMNYYRIDLDGDQRVGLFVEEITERANARRRAQRLASIVEDLAGADSTEDVAAVVAAEVADYFDAETAFVGVVDESSPRITADDDTAYGAALRSGKSVFVSDAHDRVERVGQEFNPPIEATAVMPCRSADGSVTAVLAVGWSKRIEYDRVPIDELNTMAALIGNVLERNSAAADRPT